MARDRTRPNFPNTSKERWWGGNLKVALFQIDLAPVIPEVCKGEETHSMLWLLLCLPENDNEAIRVGEKDGLHNIVINLLQRVARAQIT